MVVTITARAFRGYGIETVECMVDQQGNVLVWDDIAQSFTSCHSLSRRDQDRVRKLIRAFAENTIYGALGRRKGEP
jgi:hypothetical protein